MSDEIRLKERAAAVPSLPPEPDAAVATEVPEAPLPGLCEEPPAPATPTQNMSLIRYLDEPLWRAKGWMQLMGILFILNGAMMILSIWGIVLCWLPIWMGLTLMAAAKNVRVAAELDNQEYMRVALEKIGLFFKINGILVIIGLMFGILIGVAVALGVVGSAAMLSQGFSEGFQNMPTP